MKHFRYSHENGTLVLEEMSWDEISDRKCEGQFLINASVNIDESGVVQINGKLHSKFLLYLWDDDWDDYCEENKMKLDKELRETYEIPKIYIKRIKVTKRHGFLWLKKKTHMESVVDIGYYLEKKEEKIKILTSNFRLKFNR